MKKKKYLDLYYKWMEAEKLPDMGLCLSLGSNDKLLLLLMPDNVDSITCAAYWGFTGERRTYEYQHAINTFEAQIKFTPLRQNIVLLLACLNQEL